MQQVVGIKEIRDLFGDTNKKKTTKSQKRRRSDI
jgi:hypothetical protein